MVVPPRTLHGWPWKHTTDMSRHHKTRYCSSKPVASAYFLASSADCQRKSDSKSDLAPCLCGTNGKLVCEDGQTGNRGVPAEYPEAFSRIARWKASEGTASHLHLLVERPVARTRMARELALIKKVERMDQMAIATSRMGWWSSPSALLLPIIGISTSSATTPGPKVLSSHSNNQLMTQHSAIFDRKRVCTLRLLSTMRPAFLQ